MKGTVIWHFHTIHTQTPYQASENEGIGSGRGRPLLRNQRSVLQPVLDRRGKPGADRGKGTKLGGTVLPLQDTEAISARDRREWYAVGGSSWQQAKWHYGRDARQRWRGAPPRPLAYGTAAPHGPHGSIPQCRPVPHGSHLGASREAPPTPTSGPSRYKGCCYINSAATQRTGDEKVDEGEQPTQEHACDNSPTQCLTNVQQCEPPPAALSMLPTCPTPCADHRLLRTHTRISPTISSPGLCSTRKRETRACSGGLRREAENA